MAHGGYDAFVSYRRSDGTQVARWLRRELERFRLPKSLRALREDRLRIYLDTAYERGTSDFYEHSIRPALLASRYLIVLATPDAVGRPAGTEDWIQREVADFAAGPNGANVIAVRAGGDFSDPLPADLAARFPNIEIVDLRGAGRFWFLNPARATRLANEKLKLIAPLIDLPSDAMPRLRQEEERAQQARLGAATGVSLAVLTAVSATSIYALKSRFEAVRALEDSMFATGRMVISANSLPKTARGNLLNQGCDLLDKLGQGTASKPGLQEVAICAEERARAHESLKEHDKARGEIEKAVATANERYAERPRQDIALRLVELQKVLADHYERAGAPEAAEKAYANARDRAQQLLEKHKQASGLVRAKARASGALADLLEKQKRFAEAEAGYVAAARAVGQSLEWEPGRDVARWRAWQIRLLRRAGQQRLQLNDGAGALPNFQRALSFGRQIEPARRTESLSIEIGYAAALASAAQHSIGEADAAAQSRAEALAAIEPILANARASSSNRASAERIKRFVETALKPK